MNTAEVETKRIGQVICIIEDETDLELEERRKIQILSYLPLTGVGN